MPVLTSPEGQQRHLRWEGIQHNSVTVWQVYAKLMTKTSQLQLHTCAKEARRIASKYTIFQEGMYNSHTLLVM